MVIVDLIVVLSERGFERTICFPTFSFICSDRSDCSKCRLDEITGKLYGSEIISSRLGYFKKHYILLMEGKKHELS